MIGFLLGFTLQLIFEAGQIAGQVCGVQMGYALASVVNPDSQADSAVLATFYELTPSSALYSVGRAALAAARTWAQLRVPAPRTLLHGVAGGGRAFPVCRRNVCLWVADFSAGVGREPICRRGTRLYRQSIAAVAGLVCRNFAEEHFGAGADVWSGSDVAALFRGSLRPRPGSLRKDLEAHSLAFFV